MRPGLGAHSFMKIMVAIKYLLRHTSFAILCLGVVFLYPDRLFPAFETITLHLKLGNSDQISIYPTQVVNKNVLDVIVD